MRSVLRWPLVAALCLWPFVVHGDEIFMEPGSEPGWRPPSGAESDVLDQMRAVLNQMDEGSFEQAYWSLDPSLKALMSQDQFIALYAPGHEKLGRMTAFHVVRVTWSKPYLRNDLNGIFASVDFTRTYERARRDCGYVVMHQAADDPTWWVFRIDDHVMPDAVYDDMVGKGKSRQAEALWAQLKRGCPNLD